MGVGLAVFVRAGHGAAVVDLAAACGLDAVVAGAVEAGPRQVVLEPLDVVFGTDELSLS
jgi:phosphoribosylformylglycinamidine cyclo-ligase